jgi:hypothetical protein
MLKMIISPITCRIDRHAVLTASFGRELGEIHCATPVFAAGGEALQATQEQQQQWGGDTDRLVGRQQADGQRRGGHQQDDDGQHPLPRDPVAQRSEHEPAEWSHEERRREDRESVQESRGFISR